jgi:hypothetical protein
MEPPDFLASLDAIAYATDAECRIIASAVGIGTPSPPRMARSIAVERMSAPGPGLLHFDRKKPQKHKH